jgi:hypothetical protein
MITRHVFAMLLLSTLCACASQSESALKSESSSLLPNRAESVSFASGIYKSVRDTERATYGLLYDIRDSTDSFIYDMQKDYYENYQK